jgi:hypothetical protein
LERALQGERAESPLRPGQSCSIGQIAQVLKRAGSGRPPDAFVTAVFRALHGSQLFSRGQLHIPELMPTHRARIAHITGGGPYSLENSTRFISEVRDSGWVFRFLDAIQPRASQ